MLTFNVINESLYVGDITIAKMVYNCKVIVYVGPLIYLTCHRNCCYIESPLYRYRKEYKFDSENMFELFRLCYSKCYITKTFEEDHEYHDLCVSIYQSWKSLNDMYNRAMERAFILDYKSDFTISSYGINNVRLINDNLTFTISDSVVNVKISNFRELACENDDSYINICLIASQLLDRMTRQRVPTKSARKQ